MITVLIFLMIFVGVTAAWYQIYQMHFNINTPNDAKLSDEADTPRFEEAATRIFGSEFNIDALRIAFSQEGREAYGLPLLHRQRTLARPSSHQAGEGGVRVRHLRLFKTRLPSINVRSAFILAVIANCGLVQLLAAMSVYTIHYSVNVSAFAWVNQPVMILLAIWGVVLLNALIFRWDAYTHDLYQIRQLNQQAPLFK